MNRCRRSDSGPRKLRFSAAKPRQFHWIVIALLIAAGAAAFSASTEFAPIPRDKTWWATSPWRGIYYSPDPPEWTLEHWTKDDSRYAGLSAKIDQEMAAGQSMDRLVEKYRNEVSHHPFDPESLYRWGYAAWIWRDSPSQLKPNYEQEMDDVLRAMQSTPSPHSYHYDRLRFLLMAHVMPETQVIPFGERLARKDPNDYVVRFFLAQLLINCTYPPRSTEALAYIDEMARIRPKSANTYVLKGNIYLNLWITAKDRIDPLNRQNAEGAITAYQKSLDLAQPDTLHRTSTERIISNIRKQMAGELPLGLAMPQRPKEVKDQPPAPAGDGATAPH